MAKVLEDNTQFYIWPLFNDDIDFIASRVRGGNWTRGGFGVSAGKLAIGYSLSIVKLACLATKN